MMLVQIVWLSRHNNSLNKSNSQSTKVNPENSDPTQEQMNAQVLKIMGFPLCIMIIN